MKFDKVICIVGDRGTGKTLFAVSLAHHYATQGVSIFTNIEMYNINHRTIAFKDISDFPDWLHDGIIILDEMHVGADSYKFLNSDVQGITKFITQIRKRNLTFIYITQNFTTIAKRLRIQTNYSYQVSKIRDGVAKIDIFDNMNFYAYLKTIIFDGRKYYDFYNTNQLIE